MAGNETTTKFKVDISDLKKNIQEANRQIKLANAEFKSASAGMDDWSKSADGISAKIAQLQKVLQSQKSILASYEKQLELVEKEYGKNSKEAVEMQIKLENQKAAVKNTEKSLQDFEKALSDVESGEKDTSAQTDKLDDSLKESKKASEDAGKGFTVFKGVLTDLVANGIKAVIKGLKDLATTAVDSFKSFDEGRDKIIALTGATGDSAADLMNVYKDVASSVTGDFSDMGAAIGELSTRFGVSGKELETLSEKFLKFAKLNESDVASSVDDVQKALSAFGLSANDAGGLLDALNKVAQDTGVDVSTLTKGLIQNGTAFQEMGLSIADSASLMGQMEKSGANAETVMNGLRKALKNATKDGVPLKKALADLEKNIVSNSDSTKGLQAAYDAFGKSGDQIYGALKNGTLSFQSVSMAADDYRDSIDKTYEGTLDASDKVKLAFQSMKMSVGETVNDIVAKNGPDIEKAIGTVSGAVQRVIAWGAVNIPKLIDKIKSGVSVAAPYVTAAIETGKKVLEEVKPVAEKVFDGISKALETIKPYIEAVFGWLVSHKTELIATLAGIGAAIVAWNIATVVSGLISFVSALKAMGAASAFAAAKQWLLNSALLANPIGLVVAAVAGLVAAFVVLWNKSEKFRNFWIGLWEKIKGVAEPVITAISAFFVAAWEKIKDVWQAASAWFSAIWEKIQNSFAFKAIVNYFKMAWKNIKVVWDVAVKFFKTIWDDIKLVFSAVKAVLSGDFSGAWESIKKIFSNAGKFFVDIWNAIKSVFSNVGEFFLTIFSKPIEKIKVIWSGIKTFFSAVWESIKETVAAAVQPIISFFQPVVDFFTAAWNIIKELAAGCWETIKAVWSVVSEWFSTNIIQPIAEFFKFLWDTVSSAAQAAWDFIVGVWESVSQWFSDNVIQPVAQIFTGLWEGIKTAASTAWNFIKGVWAVVSGWFNNTIIKPVANFFTGMWNGLKNGAKLAWEGIKSVFGSVADWFKDKFSKAWQAVKDVFSTGGNVFDGIKEGIVSAFKTVVNAIIRGINKVIAVPFNAINGILDKISEVSIAGIEPFSGLVHRLPVPQIPELAEGGVLKRGQVGLLEGDGAEAVVPLERNKKWISATASELKKALKYEGVLGGATGPSGAVTNNYNFTQNNTSPKALSRLEIYRQSKNLLSWKGAT